VIALVHVPEISIKKNIFIANNIVFTVNYSFSGRRCPRQQ
jgi:hypothetical protein